jgi:hypothetical protein
MDRLRGWALKLIILLNVIALIDSFGESYAGLYRWAFEHTIVGFWAGTWPLMIDTMILAGEAGLFVAHHDRWRTRDKVWMWAGTLAALGVSVAANVGHVNSTDWLSHLTAALPPVALAFVTTVGFGVMKRVHHNKPLTLAESPPQPQAEKPRTQFTRTGTERAHVGSQPWVIGPVENFSPPAGNPLAETDKPSPETSLDAVSDPESTMIDPGLKATEKAYTMPPDTRTGLSQQEKRVRDMYTVNPDISVNEARKAVGIAWETAKKYLDATKEARGLTA